jgi:hypothetical protein
MGRLTVRMAVGLVALGFLTGGTGEARAGFILVTDPLAINKNDTANWAEVITPFREPVLVDPLTSMVYRGTVNWRETDQSNPPHNTLVSNNGTYGLFIGTAIDPGKSGNAFFDLNMYFDFHGLSVFGVGANVDLFSGGSPGSTLLTAYDSRGNSQTFDLPQGGYLGYLGVLSNEGISRLEFFSGHTAESALFIQPLDFRVVPTPPGLVLAGIGAISLLGYGWRRSRMAP